MSLIDALDSVTAPPETSVTAEEILARARAVAPRLRERAEDVENNRQLPADVVALLRGTGVFRMARPKAWGGPELDAVQQTEVIEALAQGDASAAWCAMIGMDTPIYAGFLGEDVAGRLLADPDTVTAGAIMPMGRAERVPGGYRVTGQWHFGSGITHSTWVVGGVLVTRGGELEPGPPGAQGNWRVIVAPVEDFEIQDTWYTTGLAGSGSRDYRTENLFVPEEYTFSFAAPRVTGAAATPDAVLRNMPGVPLGTARAAIDHVRQMATTRIDRTTGTPWPENYRVQIAVAQAEMDLSAARYAVYGSLREQWEILEAGDVPTRDEQVATVLARVNAFRTARSVVASLFDVVATSAVYRPSVLDRALRDLNTMCQHVIAQDQVIQSAGAHLLGGAPHNAYSVGVVL
ncbi:acyl-CoA dehydrogenase family protein [Streptomyces sp. NPDC044989]|jgi:alkylation response protein AidB-like acyl-CoA dehydrogenase|uniref:acyl-CoA dehydrogenase family protein n=1 Tax=unclassified Streptomyces TaxID=2593676 RepID=UPI0026EEA36C|nr:acyl-CoA dehydrogenase family protein [Streptomyces sp. HUAS CX7]WKX18578.1 acyl-CoA dehydrogenase family protein [Streptomyces sp. HUAS CX7]